MSNQHLHKYYITKKLTAIFLYYAALQIVVALAVYKCQSMIQGLAISPNYLFFSSAIYICVTIKILIIRTIHLAIEAIVLALDINSSNFIPKSLFSIVTYFITIIIEILLVIFKAYITITALLALFLALSATNIILINDFSLFALKISIVWVPQITIWQVLIDLAQVMIKRVLITLCAISLTWLQST